MALHDKMEKPVFIGLAVQAQELSNLQSNYKASP